METEEQHLGAIFIYRSNTVTTLRSFVLWSRSNIRTLSYLQEELSHKELVIMVVK